MPTTPNYKVQICCGTMCYIMGGADLHLLNESLPSSLKGKVSIEGTPCLGKCNLDQKAHPCVLINGEEMPNASILKIIAKLLTIDTDDLL